MQAFLSSIFALIFMSAIFASMSYMNGQKFLSSFIAWMIIVIIVLAILLFKEAIADAFSKLKNIGILLIDIFFIKPITYILNFALIPISTRKLNELAESEAVKQVCENDARCAMKWINTKQMSINTAASHYGIRLLTKTAYELNNMDSIVLSSYAYSSYYKTEERITYLHRISKDIIEEVEKVSKEELN